MGVAARYYLLSSCLLANRTLTVVPIDSDLVLAAAATVERHELSYWDSLIIEAAAASGCEELITEDLAAGSTLRGVTITNPFS